MAQQAPETGFHFGMNAEAFKGYVKGRFAEENKRAIQAAEAAMDAVDADIMSDRVAVPQIDPQGFMLSPKDAPPRLLSLSADIDQIHTGMLFCRFCRRLPEERNVRTVKSSIRSL